jgi:hypothetical protein
MDGRKILILSFILIAYVSPVLFAGDTLSISPAASVQATTLNIRQPDPQFFNRYRADKEYNYEADYAPPKSSGFLDRLWQFVVALIKNGAKVFNFLPVVIRVIMLVLFIVLLFVLFTKTRLHRIFYTDREVSAIDLYEEGIHEEGIDFEKEIGLQVTKKNFRNALRLLHLKILKDLELHGSISYSKGKTNRDYYREIKNSDLRTIFLELTGIYNRVWYGNYLLSAEEYQQAAAVFNRFTEGVYAEEK